MSLFSLFSKESYHSEHTEDFKREIQSHEIVKSLCKYILVL